MSTPARSCNRGCSVSSAYLTQSTPIWLRMSAASTSSPAHAALRRRSRRGAQASSSAPLRSTSNSSLSHHRPLRPGLGEDSLGGPDPGTTESRDGARLARQRRIAPSNAASPLPYKDGHPWRRTSSEGALVHHSGVEARKRNKPAQRSMRPCLGPSSEDKPRERNMMLHLAWCKLGSEPHVATHDGSDEHLTEQHPLQSENMCVMHLGLAMLAGQRCPCSPPKVWPTSMGPCRERPPSPERGGW